MDDLTIFSKDQSTHIYNLRQVFNRCQKYGMSLNLKSCSFGVTKGKLLSHIIYEAEISIDPKRIEAILKLSPPHSHKELKYLFGKIIFVQNFVSGFVEIEAISIAPIIFSPVYELPFKIYSFASEHSCARIVTQKKDKENERPMAFMSCPLKKDKLNYSNLDKYSFSIINVVKKFHHCIIRSKVYAIVPDPMIKTLLMQNELGER